MNPQAAEAAFSRFAIEVVSAPPDERIPTMRTRAQQLIRFERAGLLDKRLLENEIARVANELDRDGCIADKDAEAVWEILGQANGNIPLPPEEPEPLPTATPVSDVAEAQPTDVPIDE